jgi:hypothetical protein
MLGHGIAAGRPTVRFSAIRRLQHRASVCRTLPPPPAGADVRPGEPVIRYPSKGRVWAIVAAALPVVAAYADSWRNAFHFDDAHVIVSNPAIASLRDVSRFFVDARTFSSLPANQTCRPLVSLSLAVDHAIAVALTGNGLDPRAYHATQLLLLALTAILLGLVGRDRPGR